MNAETKILISNVSRNVEAIGRRISSPKNQKEDFVDLAEALLLASNTLEIIVETNFK